MEVIRASSIPSVQLSIGPTKLPTVFLGKPLFHLPVSPIPTSAFSSIQRKLERTKLFSATSSSISSEPINQVEPELETQAGQGEKFDWFAQWYPIMPVCDLDKRVPLAKKVMGLDVVVWWDRNESAWKVFHDSCPHRLAPLSEGRIDQWGRLQCVYHGWCFNGSGDCKFIPQAPPDGPSVHTFKKACVAVYPSTLQNDIVWFWPNTDPQYKDILMKKKPPYFPEVDDPSYTVSMGNREIPYGHEILIENLMDPAHLPYAHYGILPGADTDREGGIPLNMSVEKVDMNGFIANQDEGGSKFIPPCVFYVFPDAATDESKGSASSTETKKEQSAPTSHQRSLLIFFSVPVSPGKCRLIWAFPRNFGLWIDRIFPRWMSHLVYNIVFDSDLYLLHVQEHKIMDVGPSNWQKACFVPTKSDAFVVGFRRWLNKYSGGQIDWDTKFSGSLPPTPPREQLMDRYWSHVVNCRSCSVAYKGLNVFEVVLQVISIFTIGIVAATKQSTMSMAARTKLVSMAVLSFAASKWLSVFIYKNFHFHDYNHGLK